MNIITHPAFLAIGALGIMGAGIALGYFLRQFVAKQEKSSVETTVKKLLDDARGKAKELMLEVREKATKVVDEAKQEEKDRMRELRRLEERVIERQGAVDERMKDIQRKEDEVGVRIEKVRAAKVEVEGIREQTVKELERVAGLSKDDAIKELMQERESKHQ